MSTRGTRYTNEHDGITLHVYDEMVDGYTYLEVSKDGVVEVRVRLNDTLVVPIMLMLKDSEYTVWEKHEF